MDSYVSDQVMIKAQYRKDLRLRTVSIARKFSIVGLLFMVYVVYFDLVINKYPVESFYWRLLPFSFLVVLVLFAFTPLKKHTGAVNVLYFFGVTSIVTMSWGRVVIFVGTDNYHIAVNSLMVGIVCVFLLSREGLRYMLAVCMIPSVFFIPYLFIRYTFSTSELNYLGNPLLIFVACLVMAEIQDRLRFKEFMYKKIIEEKNVQLHQKNKQMNMELQLAKKIQESLIPQSPPQFPGVTIHTIYRPLEQVGGDFFDFIMFNDKNLLGIFIGDVSGHGVPAALITSMVKTLINTAEGKLFSPSALLQYINDKIIGQISGNFLTAFYGIYNIGTKTFTAARGGHPYPRLIRGADITELKGQGRYLGISHNTNIEETVHSLEKGDRLIFFTDGITDEFNQNSESFETAFLTDFPSIKIQMPIKDFINHIYEELIRFKGNETFADDVCLIGMEVL